VFRHFGTRKLRGLSRAPRWTRCNRSDCWLRTRIRCSRVAFPPKASIGETSAAAFITLAGMTLAERRFVPTPDPPCTSQLGGSERLRDPRLVSCAARSSGPRSRRASASPTVPRARPAPSPSRCRPRAEGATKSQHWGERFGGRMTGRIAEGSALPDAFQYRLSFCTCTTGRRSRVSVRH
jgi:hypothetical protein